MDKENNRLLLHIEFAQKKQEILNRKRQRGLKKSLIICDAGR